MTEQPTNRRLIRGIIPSGTDPALIALTGAIVTWWGRIEGILVWDLISLRQHSACLDLAAKNHFPIQTGHIIEQWTKARRLVFSNDPKKLTELADLELELIEKSKDRNVLVHYFWPWGNPSNSGNSMRLQSIKRKKGTRDTLEFKSVEIDALKLDKLNDDLCHLYHRVMASGLQILIGPDRLRTNDP